MDLKLTAALLTGILAAQDPQSPTTAPDLARHADLLPAEALVVLSTAPLAQQAASLERTGLHDLWQAQVDTPSGRLVREAFAAWLQERAQIDIAQFESVLTGGASWAWMPDAHEITGQWIAVFDAGAQRATVADWIDRLAERSDEVPATIPIQPLDAVLHAALAGDRLVIGSDPAVVRRALERASNPSATRLADHPAFLSARDHLLLVEPNDPFATAWIDVRSLLTLGLTEMPAQTRREVTPWLDRLGFGEFGALTLACTTTNGEIQERALFQLPAPRKPLLRAFFPDTGKPDPSLAALAVPQATSFNVGSFDVGGLWSAVLAALREDQPESVDQLRGMLGMFGTQLGLDPERDLIHNLGKRWVATGWNQPDGEPARALVVDLKDQAAMRKALDGMPRHAAARDGSFELFVPVDDETGKQGAFALGHGRLVIASTEAHLRVWIESQRSPALHPTLAAELTGLPPRVTGYSWVRFDPEELRQLVSLGSMAARQADLPDAVKPRALLRGLEPWLATLTEVRQRTLVDDRGLGYAVSSPAGIISGLFTAFAGMTLDRMAAEATLSQRIGAARDVERDRLAKVGRSIAAIRAAELRHRDRFGSFAGLDELLARGTLEPGVLETARGRDLHGVGNHLVTTILSDETDPAHFLVVAWPTDEARGTVLAATASRAPCSNQLLAHQEGMARATLEDVLVGGDWEGSWMPGWRELRPADGAGATTGPRAQPTAASPTNQTALRSVVLALESRGAEAAPELAEHLDADDPEIAARVAWVMGEFGHADAVPQLVRLVAEHADPAVRRQAVAALRRLGDERGLQASIDALDDDDPEVRTQAAAALGAIGSQRAIDALIGFLATPSDPATDPAAEPRDRAAAILALADLEARDELGELATTVSTPEGLESSALAFTFQKLSPTLEPDDEVVVLMGALDHTATLVRRYAIQRLGELRDDRSVGALERALGREGDALRPLIEVSLAEIRGAQPDPGEQPEGTAVADTGEATLWERAITDPALRTPLLAGLGALLVFGFVAALLVRRQRRRSAADHWAAMAQPSDEWAEDQAEVWDENATDEGDWAEEDGEWAEDAAYDDDDYEDEYADDAEPAPQTPFFQTSSDEVDLQDDDQEFAWPVDEEQSPDDEWDEARR